MIKKKPSHFLVGVKIILLILLKTCWFDFLKMEELNSSRIVSAKVIKLLLI